MKSKILTACAPLALATMASITTAQTSEPPAKSPPTNTTQMPSPEPKSETKTLVVTGKRADVVNKVDRKVYRTDADIQSTTGSASDVLSNIPSVEVDVDGGVTLRGDSSVTILIDGKPSSEMQGAGRGAALQSLSASDIEQIEVITSPSAEFKPDGSGGIINIVTNKNRKQGASGLLLANLGNEGRYSGNITSSYNTGAFELSGSLGVRNDNRDRISDNQTTSLTPSTSGSTKAHLTQRESNNRKSAKTSLNYTPNDKQTMGVSLNYSTREERRSTTEHNVQSGTTSGTFDRIGYGGGPREDKGIALSFEQKLAREDEVLSFDLQTSHTNESNVYTYNSSETSGTASTSSLERNFSQELYGVSEFTASYERPFASGSRLKVGYGIEYDQTGFNDSQSSATPSSAPLIIDHAFDNQFRYHQTVNSVYATYDKKFDKLELLAGLRFEQTDIDTLQNISGDTSTQSYGKFYPTVNLLYTLSETDTLTAGYSNRVSRADPEDLNPYINASDPHNLRQGNPGLKPEDIVSTEIGYRHNVDGASYSVTGYYRERTNGDTEILTVISPDVVLITKQNLGSSKSGGVEFTASGKLFPTVRYNLSGNGFYNEINAQSAGGTATKSIVSFNTKAALDYQATPKDRMQLSANYNGKRLTSQGYVLPIATMNVGYRRQITDKASVIMTVSDLFNSQRQKRVFETATFNGVYKRHQAGRVAYIGLSYLLGASKKSKDPDFTYDQ